MKTPYTFTASETRIGKAWRRLKKRFYRSPFDGKVRQVPEGYWARVHEQRAERDKHRQQQAGWWCDWVPKKDRKL